MASLRGLALLLALATASAVRSRFHYDEVSGDGRLRFMPKDVHVKALDDPSQKTYAPGVSEATTPHMHLDEFILQLDGHHDYEGGVLHNPNATSFLETSLWKTRDGGETQSKAKKAVVVAAPIVPHEADNKPAAEEWIQAGATADQRRAFHDQQAHQHQIDHLARSVNRLAGGEDNMLRNEMTTSAFVCLQLDIPLTPFCPVCTVNIGIHGSLAKSSSKCHVLSFQLSLGFTVGLSVLGKVFGFSIQLSGSIELAQVPKFGDGGTCQGKHLKGRQYSRWDMFTTFVKTLYFGARRNGEVEEHVRKEAESLTPDSDIEVVRWTLLRLKLEEVRSDMFKVKKLKQVADILEEYKSSHPKPNNEIQDQLGLNCAPQKIPADNGGDKKGPVQCKREAQGETLSRTGEVVEKKENPTLIQRLQKDSDAMRKLLPLVDGVQYAHFRFTEQLSNYGRMSARNLYRDDSRDQFGWTWRNSDGRYLARNWLGSHFTSRMRGPIHGVVNVPRVGGNSVKRGKPKFWRNVALSMANLFVRSIGDVTALFNVYHAFDTNWDGNCVSLGGAINSAAHWGESQAIWSTTKGVSVPRPVYITDPLNAKLTDDMKNLLDEKTADGSIQGFNFEGQHQCRKKLPSDEGGGVLGHGPVCADPGSECEALIGGNGAGAGALAGSENTEGGIANHEKGVLPCRVGGDFKDCIVVKTNPFAPETSGHYFAGVTPDMPGGPINVWGHTEKDDGSGPRGAPAHNLFKNPPHARYAEYFGGETFTPLEHDLRPPLWCMVADKFDELTSKRQFRGFKIPPINRNEVPNEFVVESACKVPDGYVLEGEGSVGDGGRAYPTVTVDRPAECESVFVPTATINMYPRLYGEAAKWMQKVKAAVEDIHETYGLENARAMTCDLDGDDSCNVPLQQFIHRKGKKGGGQAGAEMFTPPQGGGGGGAGKGKPVDAEAAPGACKCRYGDAGDDGMYDKEMATRTKTLALLGLLKAWFVSLEGQSDVCKNREAPATQGNCGRAATSKEGKGLHFTAEDVISADVYGLSQRGTAVPPPTPPTSSGTAPKTSQGGGQAEGGHWSTLTGLLKHPRDAASQDHVEMFGYILVDPNQPCPTVKTSVLPKEEGDIPQGCPQPRDDVGNSGCFSSVTAPAHDPDEGAGTKGQGPEGGSEAHKFCLVSKREQRSLQGKRRWGMAVDAIKKQAKAIHDMVDDRVEETLSAMQKDPEEYVRDKGSRHMDVPAMQWRYTVTATAETDAPGFCSGGSGFLAPALSWEKTGQNFPDPSDDDQKDGGKKDTDGKAVLKDPPESAGPQNPRDAYKVYKHSRNMCASLTLRPPAGEIMFKKCWIKEESYHRILCKTRLCSAESEGEADKADAPPPPAIQGVKAAGAKLQHTPLKHGGAAPVYRSSLALPINDRLALPIQDTLDNTGGDGLRGLPGSAVTAVEGGVEGDKPGSIGEGGSGLVAESVKPITLPALSQSDPPSFIQVAVGKKGDEDGPKEAAGKEEKEPKPKRTPAELKAADEKKTGKERPAPTSEKEKEKQDAVSNKKPAGAGADDVTGGEESGSPAKASDAKPTPFEGANPLMSSRGQYGMPRPMGEEYGTVETFEDTTFDIEVGLVMTASQMRDLVTADSEAVGVLGVFLDPTSGGTAGISSQAEVLAGTAKIVGGQTPGVGALISEQAYSFLEDMPEVELVTQLFNDGVQDEEPGERVKPATVPERCALDCDRKKAVYVLKSGSAEGAGVDEKTRMQSLGGWFKKKVSEGVHAIKKTFGKSCVQECVTAMEMYVLTEPSLDQDFPSSSSPRCVPSENVVKSDGTIGARSMLPEWLRSLSPPKCVKGAKTKGDCIASPIPGPASISGIKPKRCNRESLGARSKPSFCLCSGEATSSGCQCMDFVFWKDSSLNPESEKSKALRDVQVKAAAETKADAVKHKAKHAKFDASHVKAGHEKDDANKEEEKKKKAGKSAAQKDGAAAAESSHHDMSDPDLSDTEGVMTVKKTMALKDIAVQAWDFYTQMMEEGFAPLPEEGSVAAVLEHEISVTFTRSHSTDRQFSWDEWKACALPIFKKINLKKQLEKASAADGDQPEAQQKAAEKGVKGAVSKVKTDALEQAEKDSLDLHKQCGDHGPRGPDRPHEFDAVLTAKASLIAPPITIGIATGTFVAAAQADFSIKTWFTKLLDGSKEDDLSFLDHVGIAAAKASGVAGAAEASSVYKTSQTDGLEAGANEALRATGSVGALAPAADITEGGRGAADILNGRSADKGEKREAIEQAVMAFRETPKLSTLSASKDKLTAAVGAEGHSPQMRHDQLKGKIHEINKKDYVVVTSPQYCIGGSCLGTSQVMYACVGGAHCKKGTGKRADKAKCELLLFSEAPGSDDCASGQWSEPTSARAMELDQGTTKVLKFIPARAPHHPKLNRFRDELPFALIVPGSSPDAEALLEIQGIEISAYDPDAKQVLRTGNDVRWTVDPGQVEDYVNSHTGAAVHYHDCVRKIIGYPKEAKKLWSGDQEEAGKNKEVQDEETLTQQQNFRQDLEGWIEAVQEYEAQGGGLVKKGNEREGVVREAESVKEELCLCKGAEKEKDVKARKSCNVNIDNCKKAWRKHALADQHKATEAFRDELLSIDSLREYKHPDHERDILPLMKKYGIEVQPEGGRKSDRANKDPPRKDMPANTMKRLQDNIGGCFSLCVFAAVHPDWIFAQSSYSAYYDSWKAITTSPLLHNKIDIKLVTAFTQAKAHWEKASADHQYVTLPLPALAPVKAALKAGMEKMQLMMGKCLDCWTGVWCGCGSRDKNWNEEHVWKLLKAAQAEWLNALEDAHKHKEGGKHAGQTHAWAYKAQEDALKTLNDILCGLRSHMDWTASFEKYTSDFSGKQGEEVVFELLTNFDNAGTPIKSRWTMKDTGGWNTEYHVEVRDLINCPHHVNTK